MSFQSVYKAYRDAVGRFPDRSAFCIEGAYYSYAQLDARVKAISAALRQDLKPGEKFAGVATDGGLDTYAALLACWAAGLGYVPLNTHHPPERNVGIAKAADLKTVLSAEPSPTIEAIRTALPEARAINLAEIDNESGETFDFQDVPEEQFAYLLFTSGSTGQPKGVPIRHAQLNAFFRNITDPEQYDFRPEDRFLQMFDLSFDLSVFSTFAPLCVGACCFPLPEDGVSFLNISYLLEEYQLNVALMAPSVLHYLRKYFDEIRLPELRYSLFCGEALLQDVVDEWATCVPKAEIQNVYGPTEATIFCTKYIWTRARGAAESANGVVSIGKALPGMTLLIVGEGLEETDAELPGQLALSGPQVTEGYWQNPEKTAAAFIEVLGETAYLTGDECVMRADGNFSFLGRMDQQVKIDGYRVELGEIEYHLRDALKDKNAVVFPQTQESGNVVLYACIESTILDELPLKAYLKEKLPPYMRPSKYCALPNFPLNANGKIDRKMIAATFGA